MYKKDCFPIFAVIGCGNGGMAMAAHLSLMGFKVNLFNRSIKKLRPVISNKGIDLTGCVTGHACLNKITLNIGDAICDADIIMITVPAMAHKDIAHQCALHLQKGQIIVLNPGRTGGALEFRNILKHYNVHSKVIIAETQTFIYASRIIGPAAARIFSIKKKVSLAALPSIYNQKVLDLLNLAYEQFVPANSVLETSLNNIGSVFHPAPTVLNSARIESTLGNFNYYIDGITQSTACILEEIDRERINVARAIGVKAVSAIEWLKTSYGSEGSHLFEAIQNTKGYSGIKGPKDINTRYLLEDVPYSLVPIASIGKMLGIHTPTIYSIIHLSSIILNTDFLLTGRTVEKLGIKDCSVDEIYSIVMNTTDDLDSEGGVVA